jgi:hypothetical protein
MTRSPRIATQREGTSTSRLGRRSLISEGFGHEWSGSRRSAMRLVRRGTPGDARRRLTQLAVSVIRRHRGHMGSGTAFCLHQRSLRSPMPDQTERDWRAFLSAIEARQI